MLPASPFPSVCVHRGELVSLVGFTGSGLSQTNWVGFRETLPERLDRLIGEQRMPPVVVALPDCFTGSAATSTSTLLPPVLGKTFCCTKCCRRSVVDVFPSPADPPLVARSWLVA